MFFRVRPEPQRRSRRRRSLYPRLETLEIRLTPSATQLVVTSQPPASVTAKQPFGLSVAAEDQSGNIDPTYSGMVNVSLASNPEGDTLGGLTSVFMSNGVAAFSGLTLNKASSSDTLQVQGGGLSPGTTSPFAVVGGSASRLVVVSPPPHSVTAGSPFSVVYAAEDPDGNVDPTFKGSVTVALGNDPGWDTLGGITSAQFSNGLASLSGLTLTKAGTGYTLLSSSSGLVPPPPDSVAFNVTPAAPSQLAVTAPPPAQIKAGSPFDVTAAVEDQYGNVTPAFSGNLAIAPTKSQEGNLGGNVTVAVVGGVADFSGLTLDNAGVAFTLQVFGTGFPTAITSPFSVTAADPSQLVFTSPPPSSVAAGSPFGLTIDVADTFGNPVTNATGTVSLALSGGGTLGGRTPVSLVNGVATFSGLTVVPPGTGYTLQASSPGLTSATAALVVTHGAATHLVVTSAVPSTVTAGNPFGLAIAAEDPYGYVDTSYNGSITVALGSNPGGGTLGGVTVATMNNGVVTFSGLTLNKAASGYTLQLASGTLASPSPNAMPFNVTAAPTSQLVVTAQPPSTIAAGSGFGLTVTAEDQYGNVATTFSGSLAVTPTNTQAEGYLLGPVTATFSGGVATFSGLSLDRAGIGFTLQVSGAGLPAVATSPFTVTADPATQLVVTTPPPTTINAGSPFGLQLAAEDTYGNVDPTFAQTVSLTLAANPGGGTLGGTTAIGFSNGLANFAGLTIDKASNTPYALQAASAGLAPAASVSSLSITVIAAVATRLVIISPPPATITAGAPFGMAFAAEDPLGNVDATYKGGVTLALGNNPGGGTIAGFTTVQFSNGLASFSGLTINTAGSGYTLVSASSGLTPPTAASLSFNVIPAAPSQLAVTTQPPPTIAAGSPFGLTVAVEDPYGNVTTAFSGNIAVAPSDNQAEGNLGGTLTVPVINGVATFTGLGLPKAGTKFTLQVSATGLPSVTTSPFSVTAATATQVVVVSPPPSAVTAGVGFGLTVAAEDQYGNVVSSYADTVTVGLAPGSAQDTLDGTLSLPLSGGLATFTGLTLTKAGPGYLLQATSSKLPTAAPSALALTVTAGKATQLALISPPPATVTAGVGFGLVLAAEDVYGNIDPGIAGGAALALASNPVGGTLSGTMNVNFSNGLANFSGLVLDQVGQGYTLQAASNGLATLTTQPFAVTAIATQLVLISPAPTTVAVGATFGLAFAAEDSLGNIDSTFKGSVTVALGNNPGGGTLSGFTTTQFSNGLASFSNLAVSSPGVGYTLRAASDGLAPLTSSTGLTFNVTSTSTAIATRLVVVSQVPSKVAVGAPFGLAFEAEDANGNIDPAFKGSVTVALGNNPGGGILGGFTTEQFSDGLATFSNLTVSSPGIGYTLVAASSGLAPLDPSDAPTFDVTAVARLATQLAVISPVPAADGMAGPFGLAFAAEDPQGNIDPTFKGSVTLALGNNPGGAILGGLTTVQFSNGLAAFTNLTVSNAGSGYTLVAASAGLTSLTLNVPSGTTGTLGSSSGATGTVGSSGGSTSGSGSSPGSAASGSATSDPAPHLVVDAVPDTAILGHYFKLTVRVADARGATDTGFTGTVTLALANNPRGATLGGNLTMPVIEGQVTYYDLTLNLPGSGYTILASGQGLAPVTTSPLTVLNPPEQLEVTAPPPGTIAPRQSFGLIVAVEDGLGILAPSYNGSVTLSLAGRSGGRKLHGTLTVNAVNGLATFSGLTVLKARKGDRLQIKLTASGLSATMTIPISVGAAPRVPHPSRSGRARVRI